MKSEAKNTSEKHAETIGCTVNFRSESTFFGTNGIRYARCSFRALKKLDFQGPPLPLTLVMDVACIKIITSSAI